MCDGNVCTGFRIEIPWEGYRWYWWLLPWRMRLAWRRRRCGQRIRNIGKLPIVIPKELVDKFPTTPLSEIVSVQPMSKNAAAKFHVEYLCKKARKKRKGKHGTQR